MKKALKRLLSPMLALIMIFGSAAVGAVTENSSDPLTTQTSAAVYSTGSTVAFGEYPQKKVTDEETLKALDSIEKEWISYGYLKKCSVWENGESKETLLPNDYMKYADIELNGTRYRAVVFSKYRHTNADSYFLYEEPIVEAHQYYNGYFVNTVYYFEYEPIKWRVLDAASGFLVTDQLVDSQPFDAKAEYDYEASEYYRNNYEQSSLRRWLNDEFYNVAFSSEEQSKIKVTHIETKDSYEDTHFECAPTDDKVFLLSAWDLTNTRYGFGPFVDIISKDRWTSGTDYAKCQGLNVIEDYGRSNYMTRTPGYRDNEICFFNGKMHENSLSSYEDLTVTRTCYGVRPAIKINGLSSLKKAQPAVRGVDFNGKTANSSIQYEALVGDQVWLRATPIPNNAADTSIVWSSSNPEIATVDQNGIVTMKRTGRVKIYATTPNGVSAPRLYNVVQNKPGDRGYISELLRSFYFKIGVFLSKIFG